jgi:hypothetical protein
MLLGFLGDVHGHAFHAIASLATWQQETGRQFDLIIQVGDMACEPDLDQVVLDAATDPHLTLDPAEADFARLLNAEGRHADLLRRLRQHFRSPIYFLRGNHEPFAWLRQLAPNQVQSEKCRVQSEDSCGLHVGIGLGRTTPRKLVSLVGCPTMNRYRSFHRTYALAVTT